MKIAVFYHGCVGRRATIDPLYAAELLNQQMRLLESSGLAAAASFMLAGFNDTPADVDAVRPLLPAQMQVAVNPADSRSELPTMSRMQAWIRDNPDSLVCYHHIKGVSHGRGEELNKVWRQCMEHHVIRNWRRCVYDLEHGYDSAGAHWLTREQFGPCVGTFFWGGNYWWARGDFLITLPTLPFDDPDRFLAERWIGTGRRPVVRDYAPHWPSPVMCAPQRCFMCR